MTASILLRIGTSLQLLKVKSRSPTETGYEIWSAPVLAGALFFIPRAVKRLYPADAGTRLAGEPEAAVSLRCPPGGPEAAVSLRCPAGGQRGAVSLRSPAGGPEAAVSLHCPPWLQRLKGIIRQGIHF